jgi:N-carbamoyl-L-amino-acid hydrolase
MIFIACTDGRSHCPQESITPEKLAAGARVLQRTVLSLDRQMKR